MEREVQSLDLNSLEIALDCLRQGLSLESGHPLTHFVSLRDYPHLHLENTLARDYHISRQLCHLIRSQLKTQRKRCGVVWVPGVRGKAGSQELLKRDFQQENRELEAWSILYYRFVRVDLDFTLETISRLVGQAVRTLNRRQRLGFTRLLHLLIRRETKAINLQWIQYLHASLPLPAAPFLYGREAHLKWAVEYLLTNIPRHLCISGHPGVGKTTFAISVAHHLIEQRSLHKVIWLEQPEANLNWLTKTVGEKVELPEEDPLAISAYLYTHPILIVLDETSNLFQDDSLLTKVQKMFGSAYLIAITNQKPSIVPRMGYVEIPALDRNLCLEWLMSQTFVPERKQRQFLARFEGVFEQSGGNLKSLQYELCQLAS